MSKSPKKKEREQHFRNVPEVAIHLTTSGDCPQAKPSQRSRGCDHRAAAGPSCPPAATGLEPWEAHHVVCLSSTVWYLEFYPDDVIEDIRNIYRGTNWCVNNQANMKWLPLKATYTNAEANKRAVWGLDLPCHNWDHNCIGGWTDEVTLALKRRIWDMVRNKKPDGTCFTQADAEAEFPAIVTDLQARLAGRGTRKGGTAAAHEASEKEDPGQRPDRWWLPFSMATDLVAVERQVAAFGKGARPAWAAGRGERVRDLLKVLLGR